MIIEVKHGDILKIKSRFNVGDIVSFEGNSVDDLGNDFLYYEQIEKFVPEILYTDDGPTIRARVDTVNPNITELYEDEMTLIKEAPTCE